MMTQRDCPEYIPTGMEFKGPVAHGLMGFKRASKNETCVSTAVCLHGPSRWNHPFDILNPMLKST
jgi:hypothetical protein